MMKQGKSSLFLGATAISTLLFTSQFAFALDQIIRPYQSVRSAGMGGVRMTTGLYDENFFNNPARVVANPYSKFTVLQLTPLEPNSSILSEGSSLMKGGDTLKKVTDSAGNNLHDRFQ